MIDSPGHNNSNRPIKDWYYNIKDYIIKKMHTFKELKKLSAHEKNLNTRNLVDCRVHVLLFFFQGTRLKINDVIYMNKLKKYTNIIPIYSCDDPEVDEEEIMDLKECLMMQANDYSLNWIDLTKNINVKNICNSSQL